MCCCDAVAFTNEEQDAQLLQRDHMTCYVSTFVLHFTRY